MKKPVLPSAASAPPATSAVSAISGVPGAAASILDDDIVQALTAAQTDEPLDARLAARVQHQLMGRIAQASSQRHLTVASTDNTWHAFGAGVERKILNQQGEIMSYLLRIAPGGVLHAHRHPVDEECVVLSGDLRIGNEIRLEAGGFHLGRKDVLHARITSDGGAVIYLRGAVPTAELLI
jgi:anti-sigma factor ChrR (cupin superfamily)